MLCLIKRGKCQPLFVPDYNCHQLMIHFFGGYLIECPGPLKPYNLRPDASLN